MHVKSSLLKTCVIVAVIILVQAVYLLSLPGSLVRVYYTEDSDVFNQFPTVEMTAEFDGYLFDYRIADTVSRDAERELRNVIHRAQPADMQLLINIAAWVRTRMSFGKSVGSDGPKSDDAAQRTFIGGTNRGLCDRYANTFAAACQTLGIPARVIELNGHVVAEAFLRKSGQWVMVDPTLGYYLTSEGKALSVTQIIGLYDNGDQPEAAVFAAARDDDSLYRAADESTLRGIYLNGFTVVSNQQLGQRKILRCMATTFSLPIAKVQYIQSNSIKIGRAESMLRTILALNCIVFMLTALIIAIHAFRRRTTR